MTVGMSQMLGRQPRRQIMQTLVEVESGDFQWAASREKSILA
jgi:hypothetical protein